MRENVILRTVQIGDEVNRCIHHFTQSLKCEVVELHVQVENKHLIVMIPPKISISDFVDTVKGRTAIQIFNQFRYLKTRPYWGNHFWEKGYCVVIIGLDTDKIRRYVVFQERLERQPDGHANFFIGGAGDNASPGSPIYRARVSLLYVTNNNKILAYNKTFKWGEATRNGGILKQILMFPINLSKAIFGIKSHSDAFKHIKNLRDTGKMPLDKPIRLYGHSWGGAASLRLYNELEEAGIPVEQVNTFDPVSRLSRAEKPPNSMGKWNNYYPSSRTNKLPDIIAKIGGIWGKREGADNNYSVTNWNIELGGTSGHMGVLYPLLPLELKQE